MTFGNFALVTSIVLGNVIQYKLGANSFNELYGQFVKGAAEHGLDEHQAADVWDRMVSSAGYSSILLILLVTLKLLTGVCI